jgi:hypothetical protein
MNKKEATILVPIILCLRFFKSVYEIILQIIYDLITTLFCFLAIPFLLLGMILSLPLIYLKITWEVMKFSEICVASWFDNKGIFRRNK